MNVLLVEDDKQVGEFIVAELVAAGHSCVHALDGEAGQQAAFDAAYDVMVVDPSSAFFKYLKSSGRTGK